MTIGARDRKILAVIVAIAVIAGYWLLVLSPKLDQRDKVRNQLTQAQGAAQAADAKLAELSGAKRRFAGDYQTLINLGKAIPASLDMPSLIVQLYTAAQGTGLSFSDLKPGARQAAPSSSAASPARAGASASASAPSAAAASHGSDGATTSWSGAATAASGSAAGSGVEGLDSVGLDFTMKGDFYNLGDFFHQMKRFVQVANGQINVSGRLLTINSLSFDATTFPALTAKVHATIYLAPKAQGLTAGATQQGPGTASASATPAASPSSAPTPAPAATVIP